MLTTFTYRQKFLNFAVPSDEEERILIEEAMTSRPGEEAGPRAGVARLLSRHSQYLDALNGGGGADWTDGAGRPNGRTSSAADLGGPGGPMSGPPPQMGGAQ